jgi:hypothetical protein
MATGHWFTTRGKLLMLQGVWADAGGTAIRMGYLKDSQPAGLDTQAENENLDTVAGLLAIATEANFTNYARQNLTRSGPTEDDTNDRVNMDISDVTIAFAGGATNNDLYGAFFYDATTDTDDTTRILLSVDWFATPIATNGGNFTYAVTDLYRAS